VTALLLQGMQELVKRRPEEPVEWLATYLLHNNPNQKGTTPFLLRDRQEMEF
jgi:protein dpy-30